MVSPHAQTVISHEGTNILDIAVPQGSQDQGHGPRSQGQNSMPTHIYSSWVVQYKLAILVYISWTQQHPQESQGQNHSSKVIGQRPKIPCPCTSTHPIWVISKHAGHSCVHNYLHMDSGKVVRPSTEQKHFQAQL